MLTFSLLWKTLFYGWHNFLGWQDVMTNYFHSVSIDSDHYMYNTSFFYRKHMNGKFNLCFSISFFLLKNIVQDKWLLWLNKKWEPDRFLSLFFYACFSLFSIERCIFSCITLSFLEAKRHLFHSRRILPTHIFFIYFFIYFYFLAFMKLVINFHIHFFIQYIFLSFDLYIPLHCFHHII